MEEPYSILYGKIDWPQSKEKMVKIDLKDSKILYQLDINSKKSSSQIGKKVGLPKNMVTYRINNQIKKGVIVSKIYKMRYMPEL